MFQGYLTRKSRVDPISVATGSGQGARRSEFLQYATGEHC